MPTKPSPSTVNPARRRFSRLLPWFGTGLAGLALVLVLILPATRQAPSGESAADLAPVKERSLAPGDGLAPRAPNPWFFAERAYPLDEIPREAWRLAQLQARTLREAARRDAAGAREEAGERERGWTQLGPTNIGGRITGVAVHPDDGDIVYVAAAEGGVLRSSDAGQHWTPLFDEQPSLAVGAVAIDPQDPDLIYAGTGEVNPGGGSVAYGGTGVYRSEDAGETWEPLGLEETGAIGRIRIDPSNGDRLFVAAMGQLWETNTERGVYRSLDGGDSWERVLYVNDETGCVDLILRPDNPDVILAAMWQRLRQPEAYSYGGPHCAVWRSVDGGDNWTQVGGGLPTPDSQSGRIGLSLCAAQPDIMVAVYADKTGYFDGLYKSSNGGFNWTRTNDGSLSSVFASYGWWFGNVRVHPVNPDYIYVLGLEFYRSTNGGASYGDASGAMHVDHHGLDFGPGANPVLYNGNDGGVYRSTNGGSIWSKLYELPITQIYRVALDANNADALYGGAQDNGTVRTLTGALDDWDMIFGGDGFQPLVHPQNSSRLWAEYQYGSLYTSSNGGGGWSSATGGISSGDRRNWNSPLIQDPSNDDRRYFGTNKVYRSTGNTTWTAVSGDLTDGPHQGNSGQVSGTLTTLAVSPLDGDVIWAGSDDGLVHVTENGGSSWTLVSGDLPERWITSVRCDPHVRETAYLTLSGFRWAEPLPHVFRTTDLGASWQAIAGNLPEAPANDFLADPEMPGRYYVATDVGVYQSLDGGGSWLMLGPELPNVVITALALDAPRRRLVAATYGRSFFAYELGDATALPPVAGAAPAPGRSLPAFPNPSRGETRIAWELDRSAGVAVDIFTVSGRRVWSRRLPARSAGRAELAWNGQDSQGHRLPSGVYFARIRAEGRTLGSEMLVIQR